MTLVVIQRVRQRDSLVEMLQALVFAVITIWIAAYGFIYNAHLFGR